MMTIERGISRKNVVLVLGFISFIYYANAARPVAVAAPPAVFDVTKFGAKGNGKPDYNEDGESATGMAFIQAWLKACNSMGPSTVLIPKGTFVVAQVLFSGPCQSTVTVDLQGNVLADPDVTQFPNNELIVFQGVDGAKLTGPGSIDVNRPASMITPIALDKPFEYMDLMPSVSLMKVTNFEMSGIRSLNPEAFHVLVDCSQTVSITNVNFESANLKTISRSDAIFISMSSAVSITNSRIKTGDACVTVSGGSKAVTITGVTCMNGQGIRVGAQPHVTPDYNVNGVQVKNCTFVATTSGAAISPRPQAAVGQISDITFEDIVMDQAQNPITINQDFLALPGKAQNAKVSNIHFKNIRGTTTTKGAVSIICSKTSPCDGIEVADVDLKFTAKASAAGFGAPKISATCANAKVAFVGKHEGLSCM